MPALLSRVAWVGWMAASDRAATAYRFRVTKL